MILDLMRIEHFGYTELINLDIPKVIEFWNLHCERINAETKAMQNAMSGGGKLGQKSGI